MKPLKVIITCVFAFALFLSGCSKKETAIQIGAILPLTGDLAALGVPIKQSIEIAEDEINSSGGIDGKKIQVIYEDSQGDPKTAISQFNRMVSVNKIKYIISYLTGVSQALKPLADKENVLLFALSAYPPITEGSQNTFQIFFNFKEEADKMAAHIKELGLNSVAFIRSRDAATNYEITEFLIPKLKELGITKIYDETFQVGDTDFRSTVSKIKATVATGLLVAGFGSDFPNLLKEIKQQNLSSKIHRIGGVGFMELPEDTPKDVTEGFVFFAPDFLLDPSAEKWKEFVSKYKERYKVKDVSYSGVYGYGALILLTDGLKGMKYDKVDEVKKNIMTRTNYSHLIGISGFTEGRSVVTPVGVFTFREGQIQKL